jgi:hypothetical protein
MKVGPGCGDGVEPADRDRAEMGRGQTTGGDDAVEDGAGPERRAATKERRGRNGRPMAALQEPRTDEGQWVWEPYPL